MTLCDDPLLHSMLSVAAASLYFYTTPCPPAPTCPYVCNTPDMPPMFQTSPPAATDTTTAAAK